jgi:hypothetical protein
MDDRPGCRRGCPVSAGSDYLGPPPTHRLDVLAPRFREAVEAAIHACNRTHGLDAMVYETYRSDELARLYYARGRSVRPPTCTPGTATAWRSMSCTPPGDGTRRRSGSRRWPRCFAPTAAGGAASGALPTSPTFSGGPASRARRMKRGRSCARWASAPSGRPWALADFTRLHSATCLCPCRFPTRLR